ncbi:transporter [Crenobacter cavernae]|uniref:Autotransporter outer membrane beta-barrel domain-containing protein n=1 Tax=Crenobacter cavernae TaxID=2290923 RepID=A0A345Y9I7_9NEIS|nr:transporter [Crenobacter cavernae]AXK40589.1 autotransporter outer membrane beta-barrel domain-containing protein [Crenobacter cavernae]
MNPISSFSTKPLCLALAAGFFSLPAFALSTSDHSPQTAGGGEIFPIKIAANDPELMSTDQGQPSASSSKASSQSSVPQRVKNISTAFEKPGVLTPRGSFVFDPSIQFSTTSSNRVAILGYTIVPALTVGVVDVRSVSRNTFVVALGGRYGVTNRLEIEGRIPYVNQHDSSVSRPIGDPAVSDKVFNTNGNGIGDVQVGLRYQLNDPVGGDPFYIASLRVQAPTGEGPFDVPYDSATNLQTKVPTGSGFWGVQVGGSAVLPSDPAVFFGGVSYQWNRPEDVDKTLNITPGNNVTQRIGRVDPGDVFQFNFGMGFAINNKSSFSIGYDHNAIFRTKINGQYAADAQRLIHVGSLLFGYSYTTNPRESVNLILGVGTTRDSPDVQITLRAPFSL